MSSPSKAVLLDTCAVIWLANGNSMRRQASEAIITAGFADGIFVSPISAWEFGVGLAAALHPSRRGSDGAP